MADEQSISRLDRELRVILERETPNWSKQDKKIIAFAKSHAALFKRHVVNWKKGNYEKLFDSVWNSKNYVHYEKERADTSVLSQRWLVIKNLYLNYKAKKINLDSKYFDGRLSFLNSLKRKKKRRDSKFINIEVLKSSTVAHPATSGKMKSLADLKSKKTLNAKQHNEVDSTKINALKYTENIIDLIGINAPKCTDNFTNPTKINASKEPKATTASAPSLPSTVDVYKPGSFVSGAYLEVQSDLKKLTESEAVYLYKYHFCNDLRDENILVKKNITSMSYFPVPSSQTVSVEEGLATIDDGNNEAYKESITLNGLNADNHADTTSVAVAPKEVKQGTSSNELRDENVLVNPNEDTRDFFKRIGKYITNKYPDRKQNEILLEVCSLVTAAELQLLDDDDE